MVADADASAQTSIKNIPCNLHYDAYNAQFLSIHHETITKRRLNAKREHPQRL